MISAIPDLDLKKALDYFTPDKKILKEPLNDSGIFHSPKNDSKSKVGLIPEIRKESLIHDGIPRKEKISTNGRKDYNNDSLLNEYDVDQNFTLSIMCNDCDFEAPSELCNRPTNNYSRGYGILLGLCLGLLKNFQHFPSSSFSFAL